MMYKNHIYSLQTNIHSLQNTFKIKSYCKNIFKTKLFIISFNIKYLLRAAFL